jgi:hypothetical protein
MFLDTQLETLLWLRRRLGGLASSPERLIANRDLPNLPSMTFISCNLFSLPHFLSSAAQFKALFWESPACDSCPTDTILHAWTQEIRVSAVEGSLQPSPRPGLFFSDTRSILIGKVARDQSK